MGDIKRGLYYSRVEPFINKPSIKVITGLRRSGKSYFLREIISELKNKFGIKSKQIIYIDKENIAFDAIKNYKDLDSYIKSQSKTLGAKIKKYLFVDEIQDIEQWEKLIRSLSAKKDFDIYISGSNSSLLSSELATYIAGRYIEINIYPLSFREFLDFRKAKKKIKRIDPEKEFELYLRYGALPGIHDLELTEDAVYPFLNSILDTILLREIMSRFEIRSTSAFMRVVRFVFDNIGNTFSAKKIADFFKSQKLSISVEVVQNYLSYLESAFAIKKISRYDIKGRRHLEIHEKYFLADIGLRNALLGYRHQDISQILENLVCNELILRGYKVSVAKLNENEIDFIAEKQTKKRYIQVSYILDKQSTIDREFEPLLKTGDNYPKYLISMDKRFQGEYQGIQCLNLIDFLCGAEI